MWVWFSVEGDDGKKMMKVFVRREKVLRVERSYLYGCWKRNYGTKENER